MPSELIDRFRQLSSEMSSAIEADDSEAVTALDSELSETWNQLLGIEAGDTGELRSLVGFFLDMLVPDDSSAPQSEARARILELIDAGRP
ncbi:MAG: hypothetical protein K8F35_07645 [Dokdonella sp.]|uniref:hypothetical protein n=1 Tax=Dokdonella sp. TaxID=2291710 RepID=UPI0025BD293C|nr:hypothetical protein [Dokdonella sp.]MBZ0222888.1 hypothetical protein [Dokdonella sp.]